MYKNLSLNNPDKLKTFFSDFYTFYTIVKDTPDSPDKAKAMAFVTSVTDSFLKPKKELLGQQMGVADENGKVTNVVLSKFLSEVSSMDSSYAKDSAYASAKSHYANYNAILFDCVTFGAAGFMPSQENVSLLADFKDDVIKNGKSATHSLANINAGDLASYQNVLKNMGGVDAVSNSEASLNDKSIVTLSFTGTVDTGKPTIFELENDMKDAAVTNKFNSIGVPLTLQDATKWKGVKKFYKNADGTIDQVKTAFQSGDAASLRSEGAAFDISSSATKADGFSTVEDGMEFASGNVAVRPGAIKRMDATTGFGLYMASPFFVEPGATKSQQVISFLQSGFGKTLRDNWNSGKLPFDGVASIEQLGFADPVFVLHQFVNALQRANVTAIRVNTWLKLAGLQPLDINKISLDGSVAFPKPITDKQLNVLEQGIFFKGALDIAPDEFAMKYLDSYYNDLDDSYKGEYTASNYNGLAQTVIFDGIPYKVDPKDVLRLYQAYLYNYKHDKWTYDFAAIYRGCVESAYAKAYHDCYEILFDPQTKGQYTDKASAVQAVSANLMKVYGVDMGLNETAVNNILSGTLDASDRLNILKMEEGYLVYLALTEKKYVTDPKTRKVSATSAIALAKEGETVWDQNVAPEKDFTYDLDTGLLMSSIPLKDSKGKVKTDDNGHILYAPRRTATGMTSR